jgi:hypothetical protein
MGLQEAGGRPISGIEESREEKPSFSSEQSSLLGFGRYFSKFQE